MGVLIRRTKGGIFPYWIGRWEEDGKRHETTLCRWKGTPPGPGEKHGNAAFEKSRGRAEALFKQIRDGEKTQEEEAALVRKVLASRYGGRVPRVKLADLAASWDALPHKADLRDERRARVHSVLARFVEYMAENFPRVTDAGALKEEHFKGFLDAVDASGVSARTWNDYLFILRGVLMRLDVRSRAVMMYLSQVPRRDVKTIHRRPFTPEELRAIFTAAKNLDTELYPVIVAAAYTALRRGDVCRLRWSAVDFRNGIISARTSKTNKPVRIKIEADLREVLEDAWRKRKPRAVYVFPGIALAYGGDQQRGTKGNPDGLNKRLQRVLHAAGFAKPEQVGNAGKYPRIYDDEATFRAVEDGMARAGWTEKRKAKARKVLALHLDGKNGKQIAEALEVGKGAVSAYLHAMEEVGEVALVSPPVVPDGAEPVATLASGEGQRKHRGSLCGWHAFRTTWATRELQAGASADFVRKAMGHTSTKMLEEFYDQGAGPECGVGGVIAAKSQTENAEDEGTERLYGMILTAKPEVRQAVEALLASVAKGGGAK